MISTERFLFDMNQKPTRWYKCKLCSEQFAYRRLLEVHKKRCSISVGH